MDDAFEAQLRASLAGPFRAEAHMHARTLSRALMGEALTPALLSELFRAAHSLKGAASAVGKRALQLQSLQIEQDLAQALEHGPDAEIQHRLSERISALLATLADEDGRRG